MIQRIQTIWLLLAATASLLTLKFSFYSGMLENNVFTQLNGSTKFILLILSVAIALIAVAAVFFYKKRKLQMQLSLLGILFQTIVIVIYYLETAKFKEGNYTLSSVLTLVIPIFFFLAWLGIRKDEKLIKSMDRLR
jgi:hypothetical protein